MIDSRCPFCNAELPPLASEASGDRVPCPRCGEPVPAGRYRVAPSLGVPQAVLEKPSAANRKTAGLLVGMMLVMAFIGLSYALWTVKQRQARHPWMPNKVESIAPRSPRELAALGYLPKDCQIVVGLQVGEWLQDKSAKKLLDEPRPALLDQFLKQLTRSTGLKLEQIDHAVLGSALDGQAVIVIRTLQPYSLQKVSEAVRPTHSSNFHEQPLYEFSVRPMGEAMLWCVEDRTMILVLRLDAPKREHLAGLSATPRPVEAVLPASVRELMEDRLARHNLAWSVGRLEELGPIKELLPALLGAKELGAVKDINRFGLGLQSGEMLTLTGHFQMTNVSSATRFKETLDALKLDAAASQKAEMTPPEVTPAWVSWQVRGDIGAVRALLDRKP